MKYEREYTNDLPEGLGGQCKYPLFPYFGLGTCIIQIKPEYRSDVGLLNHELKHVAQYNNDWFHAIKVKFSKAYRYKIELEAYAEQLKIYKYKDISQCDWIIKALFTKYDLKLDVETIKKDVTALFNSVK